jgi:hypothetical protein
MRVGFIGLGSQGAPMARRINEGGFDLTLWARRPASLGPFAGTPAKIASTPSELGATSDLVCVCVVGDDDVREVLNGDAGVLAGMRPGGIVAIHSTIHPVTCRVISETAAGHGVSVIRRTSQRRRPRSRNGHADGHGRRRGRSRREMPSGVCDVFRCHRPSRPTWQRPGRQDPQQSAVQRQPRNGVQRATGGP